MKSCTSLWREADFEVKRHKTPQRRSTFGSCDVEKVHGIVAGSTFGSQNVQNIACSEHFWAFRCRLCGRRKGFCTLLKTSKTGWFCSSSKSVGRRGTFTDLKRICKDEFRVPGTVQDTCSSGMLGGPGADFLRGVAFWRIRSSGLLR